MSNNNVVSTLQNTDVELDKNKPQIALIPAALVSVATKEFVSGAVTGFSFKLLENFITPAIPKEAREAAENFFMGVTAAAILCVVGAKPVSELIANMKKKEYEKFFDKIKMSNDNRQLLKNFASTANEGLVKLVETVGNIIGSENLKKLSPQQLEAAKEFADVTTKKLFKILKSGAKLGSIGKNIGSFGMAFGISALGQSLGESVANIITINVKNATGIEKTKGELEFQNNVENTVAHLKGEQTEQYKIGYNTFINTPIGISNQNIKQVLDQTYLKPPTTINEVKSARVEMNAFISIVQSDITFKTIGVEPNVGNNNDEYKKGILDAAKDATNKVNNIVAPVINGYNACAAAFNAFKKQHPNAVISLQNLPGILYNLGLNKPVTSLNNTDKTRQAFENGWKDAEKHITNNIKNSQTKSSKTGVRH